MNDDDALRTLHGQLVAARSTVDVALAMVEQLLAKPDAPEEIPAGPQLNPDGSCAHAHTREVETMGGVTLVCEDCGDTLPPTTSSAKP